MTIDEKKKWLWRYRDMITTIKSLREQRAEMYEVLMHITPQFSDIPPAGYGDGANKMAKAYERIEAQSAAIAETLAACCEIQEEIMEAVNSVGEDRLRNILLLHFMQGYSFTKVADIVGYDERHVRRLCRAALEKIIIPGG